VNWENLAQNDPMWAILTVPDKKGKKWKPSEFFATGEGQVSHAMKVVQEHGDVRRNAALDFGCGIGRLTNALAKQFKDAYGVDFSPTMINLAKKYTPHSNCHFILNQNSDLSIFGDNEFDFIYSYITLQHMRSEFVLKYVAEFLRILAPGGVAAFQAPYELPMQRESPAPARIVSDSNFNPMRRYKMWRESRLSQMDRWIDMYPTPRREIENVIARNNGKLLLAAQDDSAPPYLSFMYYVQKDSGSNKSYRTSSDAELTRDVVQNLVDSHKLWWHTITLPYGIKTPGVVNESAQNWVAQAIPGDLTGKQILDVGTNDGYYSFLCERRGATVWAIDNLSHGRGTTGFDIASRLLASHVNFQIVDLFDLNPDERKYNIVLFFGVYYHLQNPLLALQKMAQVTTEMLLLEGKLVLGGTKPLMEFYPDHQGSGNTGGNWWGANEPCLLSMLEVAGFRKAETIAKNIGDGNTGRILIRAEK